MHQTNRRPISPITRLNYMMKLTSDHQQTNPWKKPGSHVCLLCNRHTFCELSPVFICRSRSVGEIGGRGGSTGPGRHRFSDFFTSNGWMDELINRWMDGWMDLEI